MNRGDNKNVSKIESNDGGFLYSLIIVSVMLVSILFSLGISVFAGGNKEVLAYDSTIIINYLLGPIALLLAIGVLRYKSKKQLLKPLFTCKITIKHALGALFITFGLMFGLGELNNYFASFLNGLGVEISAPTLPTKTPINVALTILFVCVMPALFEEVAFRGIIAGSLKSTGYCFALITSGVVFAFFHMSPAQTIYQFIVGVIYVYIILNGGSLILTISMHFINNFYIVLNYYFWGFALTGTVKIIVLIVAIISLVVGIVLFYKKQENNPPKEIKKQNRIIFIMSAVIGFSVALVMWIQGLL